LFFIYSVKSLTCKNNNQDILKELAKTCKSIGKLKFYQIFTYTNISGIIRLIEVQKNLNYVKFEICDHKISRSFSKPLEELLIKQADTIQHLILNWIPVTEIFSYLINLLSLEIDSRYLVNLNNLNYLEDNFSLPLLKILKVADVPPELLAKLIESTNEQLSEISIIYYCEDSDESCDDNNVRILQSINQNCPKLKYLQLGFDATIDSINSEFETLLTNNCQFLNGLIIDMNYILIDVVIFS
jgi:hypothetical protein